MASNSPKSDHVVMEEEEVKTSKDDGNSKGSISEDPTVVESQVTSDLVTAGSSNSAVSFAQDTKSFCESIQELEVLQNELLSGLENVHTQFRISKEEAGVDMTAVFSGMDLQSREFSKSVNDRIKKLDDLSDRLTKFTEDGNDTFANWGLEDFLKKETERLGRILAHVTSLHDSVKELEVLNESVLGAVGSGSEVGVRSLEPPAPETDALSMFGLQRVAYGPPTFLEAVFEGILQEAAKDPESSVSRLILEAVEQNMLAFGREAAEGRDVFTYVENQMNAGALALNELVKEIESEAQETPAADSDELNPQAIGIASGTMNENPQHARAGLEEFVSFFRSLQLAQADFIDNMTPEEREEGRLGFLNLGSNDPLPPRDP